MVTYLKSGVAMLAASCLLIIAAFGLISEPAEAQNGVPVELHAKNGTFALNGNLLSFDGDAYVVATEMYGVLRIEARVVNCIGIVCPNLASPPLVASVAEDVNRFGIHGSGTIGTTLIPNLIRGYAQSIGVRAEFESTSVQNERIARLVNADGSIRTEIDLRAHGSGSAFPSLADGSADIGVSSRRMKDSDVEKLAVAGYGDLRDTPNEIVLGTDGIVLVTHPDNPIEDLSTLDIARIYSGEVTNWSEFGGANISITPHSLQEKSGTRAMMMDAFMVRNNREERAGITRWADYPDMIGAVQQDVGAIGYTGRWLAKGNDINIVDIRESCGIVSSPTDFRLKIEGYSMSRRLYAYTKPEALNPEARAFIDWTRTPAAQQYIKESHFIDRELERMRFDEMGDMLVHTLSSGTDFSIEQYQDMTQQLRQAERLSMSFRFRFGSSDLDVEAVRGIRELAERIRAGEFAGHDILFVGFADAVGGGALNTALALERAQTVQQSIRAAGVSPTLGEQLVSMSYGEMLPLSCNSEADGRARNRRVEVWVRPVHERLASR